MRHRHRSKVEPEWPAAAESILGRWPHLDAAQRDRIVEQAKAFDRSTSWEGLDGLTVKPEMRALVAVHACLLTVNLGPAVLRDVTTILIAPTTATKPTRHVIGGGVVTEARACVLGESLLHGPVRLAWDRVHAEAEARLPSSVVLHEFAHKIDMADGDAGGTPPISDRKRAAEFERVARAVLDRLSQ